MQQYWHIREEFSAVAMALVAEFDGLPAGAVLRHFGRAVQFARVVDTPCEEIPRLAAEITRTALGPRMSASAPVLRTA